MDTEKFKDLSVSASWKPQFKFRSEDRKLMSHLEDSQAEKGSLLFSLLVLFSYSID